LAALALVTTALVVAVLGLVAALAYEHAQVSIKEQQALNTFYEERNSHRRDVAALFLRAVVEGDYRAARLLLRTVAEVPPQAPEAFGPEVKLRDQIQGWLKERKLDGKRFKGFERGGELPGGPPGTANPDKYVQIGGLEFEDGQVVKYRLTLVRANCQSGRTSEANGWRVDELVLWSGERDGPRPW
jgi:hypothetical protein